MEAADQNQEVVQEEVSQETQPQDSQEKNSTESPEKNKLVQENWRLMREKHQHVEKERDDAMKRIKEYEQLLKERNSAPPVEEEDEVQLNPDDIPEWKHVDKRYKKLEKKLKEYEKRSTEQAEQSKKSQEEALAESKLKSNFPDYYSVVNDQSIKELVTAYPEIAESINSNNDMYTKAAAAYNIIKNMGISGNTYDKEKEIVQRNSSKPRPLTSMSTQEGANGPLSHANAFSNGLTPELKKQLYKEMVEARKKG